MVTSTVPFVNIPTYPDTARILDTLGKLPNVTAFDMEQVAKEKATLRASNMVLLGAASPYIDLSPEKIEAGIQAVFGPKGEKMVETNIAAFRAGRETALSL